MRARVLPQVHNPAVEEQRVSKQQARRVLARVWWLGRGAAIAAAVAQFMGCAHKAPPPTTGPAAVAIESRSFVCVWNEDLGIVSPVNPSPSKDATAKKPVEPT